MSEKKEEKAIEPEVIDGEVSSEEKQMAMLGHLLALVGGFVAPLIIYLIKKDESEFVKDQARESLNFQITIFIAAFTSIILAYVTCGIGGVLIPVVGILNLVFCIMGGVKANDGIKYKYPINIRIIK